MQAIGRLEDGFRVRVQTGGHEYVLDEPVSQGGTDQGAIPGEVLTAALVGCQAMVCRLWFRKNRIEPRSVEVVVDTEGEANMTTGEIQQDFHSTVKVDADITDEQMVELRDFVEQMCMVGTMLKQENKVTIAAERA